MAWNFSESGYSQRKNSKAFLGKFQRYRQTNRRISTAHNNVTQFSNYILELDETESKPKMALMRKHEAPPARQNHHENTTDNCGVNQKNFQPLSIIADIAATSETLRTSRQRIVRRDVASQTASRCSRYSAQVCGTLSPS